VGKDPAFAFGTALPFGMNTRANNAWLLQGGGNDLINAFTAPMNVFGLPGGNTGAQMGGWFRKELKSLDDLKGLKMRITGLGGRILAGLGVVPQQIAGGDIYPALERGTIDAVEFIGPHDDEKLGLERIAPYYYYPGWWEGGASLHICFHTPKWDALPKAYQAACRAAAAEANIESLARYDAFNASALRRLVASGAQLRPFPRDVLDAAYDAAFKLYDQFAQESPAWRTIYQPWKAFRDETFLWYRVAENPFDSYVYGRQARG
jgi:TRAP-type mannitol/chloroaromatic compound transport system substrate-binding protein